GFVTLTKDGFEVNAKNEADLVLGKLLSDNKVSWNANAKTIKFENGITINSNNKFSPATTVSMGVSPTTKLPVAKVTLKSSPVKGALNNHTYVTSEISITIELTPIPPSAKASPIPSAKPVPAPSSNGWDYLIAGSLIAGAAVIVIATIAEDIVTAGAGVADDPASFSAAAAMITRGITMIKRVQTNTAIMIEGASIGAVNMAH
ncbi:MAG: hypothetical protein KAQ67_07210, partial [Gammaproteobacteria bacterium]|nr:hypothetical protein [Gammaproteobacteria bacterium]